MLPEGPPAKMTCLTSAATTPPQTFALSHIQVILCFSPVGSVLRVRARKFPAVVNCTAINWFHEWPEDALVSVSARFLQETEGIQVRQRAPRCWLQSLTRVSLQSGNDPRCSQSCSIGEHLFKSTKTKTEVFGPFVRQALRVCPQEG